MRYATLSVLIILCVAGTSLHAATAAQRDPQAITLAQQSLQALVGTTALSDATLQGTANFTAGSDEESGAFTLEFKGDQESKAVLNLSGGQRQEIRNAQTGGPQGVWIGTDGQKHAMLQHNLLVPAASFFPALVLAEALNDPSIQLAYVGQEMKGDVVVQHVQLWRTIPTGLASDAEIKLFEHMTTVDVYLAAANSLPVALDFNAHPDNNEKLDIPVEIQYSDYQKTNGLLLPVRVQKFFNGSLQLDLSIAGVAVNSGIPDSEFNTQ
jgi:hypothetical protein